MAIGNLFGTGSESNSLYGTSLTSNGASSFIYFEWFIFKVSTGQPTTPTGGSWDFLTNTGTPPTGWTSTVNGVPLDNLWFSVAFVDSRNPTNIVWSTAGLLTASTSVYATAYADTFTGNGSTTNWTLTQDPVVVNNLDVSINGVTQTPTVDYTISGTTFTTTTAAPLGSIILVKYRQALPNSYFGTANNVGYTPFSWIAATNVQAALNEVATDVSATDGVSGSNLVGYKPAGTGAVATTVQAKLRENVSVKDFGAVGNGIADDTAAIQAALNYNTTGLSVYFPHGKYKITSTITIPTNKSLKIYGDGYNPQDLTPTYGSIIIWSGASNGTMFSSNTTDGLNLSGLIIKDLRIHGSDIASIGMIFGATGAHPQGFYFENLEIAGFRNNSSDAALDLSGGNYSKYGVADSTFINCIFSGGARAVKTSSQQLNFYGCIFGALSGGTLVEMGDNSHPKFFGCGFYGSVGINAVFGIQGTVGIDGLECYGCWNEGQLKLITRLAGTSFSPAIGAFRVLFSGQRCACDPAGAAGYIIDLRGLACNLVWQGGSNDNVSSSQVVIEAGSSMTVYGLQAGAFNYASITGGANAMEFNNSGVIVHSGPGISTAMKFKNDVAITAQNSAGTAAYRMMRLTTANVVEVGDDGNGILTKLAYGPSANFGPGSANANGIVGVNSTTNELVYYANGLRYKLTGTSY